LSIVPGETWTRMNEAEKKAARAAAETDGADDPVLPAGAVRRHSRADGHQDPAMQ